MCLGRPAFSLSYPDTAPSIGRTFPHSIALGWLRDPHVSLCYAMLCYAMLQDLPAVMSLADELVVELCTMAPNIWTQYCFADRTLPHIGVASS